MSVHSAIRSCVQVKKSFSKIGNHAQRVGATFGAHECDVDAVVAWTGVRGCLRPEVDPGVSPVPTRGGVLPRPVSAGQSHHLSTFRGPIGVPIHAMPVTIVMSAFDASCAIASQRDCSVAGPTGVPLTCRVTGVLAELAVCCVCSGGAINVRKKSILRLEASAAVEQLQEEETVRRLSLVASSELSFTPSPPRRNGVTGTTTSILSLSGASGTAASPCAIER